MTGTVMVWLLAVVAWFCFQTPGQAKFDIFQIERPRIMAKAARYLKEAPRTITAYRCERSPGGPHDFYSEGDYWWPDPQNPGGPYIRRDGETNPDNFIAHREAMIRLSDVIGTMASAYVLTGEARYVTHAVKHLKAWFVVPKTKMNPHLLYGQAIKGVTTGRSIGIIDTIHLVEVARGTLLMSQSPAFSKKDFEAVKQWFKTYLHWINTHPSGQEERAASNNHGVCWSLQAAAFAELAGDESQLKWVRNQFKNVFLKEMMDRDGGFPRELARTKPYGYSLFVIDAMAGVAQIASTPEEDLWLFELPDGRGMKKGMGFIFPYIQDKSKWPKARDVMYWEQWPVRQPSLLFAGVKLNKPEYLETWRKLKSDPEVYEVLRNLPLRHPLLWLSKAVTSGKSEIRNPKQIRMTTPPSLRMVGR